MSTYSGQPKQQKLRTSLDYIGQLIGLYRLPEENLIDFKNRILDTYIHKASATEEGLYNSINRELGLDGHGSGLFIDVARDSEGLPLNNLASLEINSRYLILYDDYTNNSVQAQFDLHDRNSTYFVGDLISEINATGNWEAISLLENDFFESSKLKHGISVNTVRNFKMKDSLVNNLSSIMEPGNFLLPTVIFNPNSKITTEVTALPESKEEFYIDYNNNLIYTYIIPRTNISFQYQKFPYFAKWSPIEIYSFKDSNFIDMITEEIINENNETTNGIPTQVGAEYINELLSISPQYWGA